MCVCVCGSGHLTPLASFLGSHQRKKYGSKTKTGERILGCPMAALRIKLHVQQRGSLFHCGQLGGHSHGPQLNASFKCKDLSGHKDVSEAKRATGRDSWKR
ncbi:UNVERIFIED_CONTAM: hypothetical protein K2H54_024637 [Gekko kuhli]